MQSAHAPRKRGNATPACAWSPAWNTRTSWWSPSEVQIADGLHLAALADDEYESVMLFVNHSCEPNVGFGGNIVLVAMRDIQPGEELTTDYALFDDYDGVMECACGRPNCRGTIDGRDWQRPELQAKYAGYFSWYLAQKIRQ